MGDLTALVNHMKEAMRQKETEYQSVLKQVKHLMPPLLTVKLCDQRLTRATTAQSARWREKRERLLSDVSLRSGQH